MLFLPAPWAYRTKICILFLPRDNFYIFSTLKSIQFLPNTISTGVLRIEIRKDHAVKGETNCMKLFFKGRAKRAENFRDTISTKLRICIFLEPENRYNFYQTLFLPARGARLRKIGHYFYRITISTILFSQNFIISPDILFFL